MHLIRKISVGPDVLKSMNFSVGQPMLNAKHKITYFEKHDNGEIDIWLSNSNDETYLWKTINRHVPVVIEYNIEY